MQINPANPVIVQGDGKVLLETQHPRFNEARDFLARFAELESSPDLLHTYRITPLSLWNAASSGMSRDDIVEQLRGLTKFDIPAVVLTTIDDTITRYGLVKLQKHPDDPDSYRVEFETLLVEKLVRKTDAAYDLIDSDGRRHWKIPAGMRGIFKQRLLQENWPVEDLIGFAEGDPVAFKLRATMKSNGKPFEPRYYQKEAVDRWFMEGQPGGGHGVVVLPCGAGKTIVSMVAMARIQQHTLILCNNQTAVDQWVRELLDKTTLTERQVGTYTGKQKTIKPITVATYQVMTWRRSKNVDYEHLHLFRDHNWGLLIYDEVHLLPAPVFGATAGVQGCRRLGVTATLVREDGREGDVFSLVGPKRYDLPWQLLEKQGFVAEARCFEVRVPFSAGDRDLYESSNANKKFRMASENPLKIGVVEDICKKHSQDNVLIIGTYLEQLRQLSKDLGAPLITGQTPHREREKLFKAFRTGQDKVLVVSKVANFAIDLPDANVAIQVSGSFGSRQEEAQRLGRILRPKAEPASFYTIVTADSKEQEFAMKRQLFLTEQGYRYYIEDRVA